MPHIAIIGKDSYIGSHIVSALKQENFVVSEVDALDDHWRSFDFSTVDAVVHVAAIVHRKDIMDETIYHDINVKLPVEVAQTARAAGVRQFVFLSSMAVYGRGHVLRDCHIEPGTTLAPQTAYAKSKLAAEQALLQITDDNMSLAIVRPPSVYGRGCRGNLFDQYQKIANLLRWIPKCRRSYLQGVVSIDNLAAAVCEIIREKRAGFFHPQDSELLTVSEMLCEIRRCGGKKARLSPTLGVLAKLLSFTSAYKKLFGAVYYSDEFRRVEGLTCPMETTRDGLRRMYYEEK